MKIVFVSNFLNHHQLPLSQELLELVGEGNYFFIATTPTGGEQLRLGYQDSNHVFPFVITTYDQDNHKEVIDLIFNADLVIWGGAPRNISHKLLGKRIRNNKIIFRYSERIFKRGMWRAITPARIAYMLLLHTQYRKREMYMLCASAYLPYELSLFNAYPAKLFRWGYFPPFITYNIEELLKSKLQNPLRILWVGRLIPWKHPEIILEICKRLVKDKIDFHCDIVGSGILETNIQTSIEEHKLSSYVTLCGSMPPEKVRKKMEDASVVVSTSDFNEGWGAVINEAMNSGCVVIASHAIGSVPFLIEHGKNGFSYENGNIDDLYSKLKLAVSNPNLRQEMGLAAYKTISGIWNARVAAKALLELFNNIKQDKVKVLIDIGPCSDAPIISEHKMNEYILS